MFFTGSLYGAISHIRTCLNQPAGGTYNVSGQPVRASSAADPDAFLNGQSKLTLPYLMLTVGNTTNEGLSHAGQNARVMLVERMDIYAVLDTRTSKVGKDAADQIHQVRLDLLSCFHGWNPARAASCATPPVDYGYNTLLMQYVGDNFFSFDRERLTWEFSFEIRSTLDVCNQGFIETAGGTLDRIYADFTPTDTDATDHPFPESDIELT